MGNPLGGLIDFGKNLVGDLAGGLIGQGFNRRAAEQQYHLTRDLYGSRYQLMTEDLRKAGLNPILAFSSFGSAGSSPSLGLAHPSQNIGSLMSNVGQFMRNETYEKDVRSRIAERGVHQMLMEAQTELTSLSREKIPAEKALMYAQRLKALSDEQLNYVRQNVNLQDIDLKKAQVVRANFINSVLGNLGTIRTEILKGLNGNENMFHKFVSKWLKTYFDFNIGLVKDWWKWNFSPVSPTK